MPVGLVAYMAEDLNGSLEIELEAKHRDLPAERGRTRCLFHYRLAGIA